MCSQRSPPGTGSFLRSNTAGTLLDSAQFRVGSARSGATAWSGWVTLSTGRHAVEVSWQSARAAAVSLSLDGQIAAQLTGLDTRAFTIDTVRLGPSTGLAKTMTGELQFDRFVIVGRISDRAIAGPRANWCIRATQSQE